MRVTVCQWPDETQAFTRTWGQLAAHVKAHRSELVLLPQMPFSPWFAASEKFDAAFNAKSGKKSDLSWILAVLLVLTMMIGAVALIFTMARLFALLYTGGMDG